MKKLLLSVTVIATIGLTSCGGASLCECIGMDQDKLTPECETMQTEYATKLLTASEEEQKAMGEEVAACMKENAAKAAEEAPATEAASEICACADMSVAMMNEMTALDGDMEKMTEITEKYADDMKKCEAMEEGKSDEELEAMMEEMKGCASYQELKKMMGAH